MEIEELNRDFSFSRKPDPVPGDLRPIWRVVVVILMLYMASRGIKSSIGRLHVLNWAIRNSRNQRSLLKTLESINNQHSELVRIEPSLNRAVDYAHGEGLVERVRGDRIGLTDRGIRAAQLVLKNDGVLSEEKQFLTVLGKKLTEQRVRKLLRQG